MPIKNYEILSRDEWRGSSKEMRMKYFPIGSIFNCVGFNCIIKDHSNSTYLITIVINGTTHLVYPWNLRLTQRNRNLDILLR